MNSWMAEIQRWHEYYTLVGTAAATLMGLTFVAISLAPEVVAPRTAAVRAFTTPIVAFFATALIVSIWMLVPHMIAAAAGIFLAAIGIVGIGYIPSTGIHRQWRDLKLEFDDAIWYMGLPISAYGAILAGGIAFWREVSWGSYAVAGGVLVLLVVGIRNAWDVVLAVARESRS